MSHVIILGDPHIGKSISLGKVGIGNQLNSRVIDQMNLLDWVLEQATDNVVDDIVITGDVFEEPKPAPQLIALFMGWLKKCQAHGVSVHIIVGNHDILRSGSSYVSPLDIISEVELDGIFVYSQVKTVLLGRTGITFVPFRDRKSFALSSNAEALSVLKEIISYELAVIPGTYHKLLIGHLALEGSIPVGDEIDDLTNELFCPPEMFSGYDAVLMGHVHNPQIMSLTPHIAHIGSMDISNFGETEHRKHIILFDTGTGHMETKTIPCRPLRKLSFVIPEGTTDSTEFVLNELKNIPLAKAIVRVEVSLPFPELPSVNKAIIERTILSSGAFAVSGIVESKRMLAIKKQAPEGSPRVSLQMDVTSAIDNFAKMHIDESMRELFISTASAIVSAVKEKGTK